jgi:acetyl/propionyl-CoA carboxylase alpha subunit
MTRLLIANRGEIARRILRTARERGYTVAVLSTREDAGALVRREADAVLEVSSFLAMDEIVKVAGSWRADLLHPGYGFLSENAAFALAMESAGIRFVGPTPENMRALGSKESAKALARSCGVPTLEAIFARDLMELPREKWGQELVARGLRPPFLVKASGGGGGRGMRVVDSVTGLRSALQIASSEAQSAFGDGTVFLERYLRAPRHVEVQVFGDGRGHGVFLGERECSLQRRHQKVVEESPSAVVNAELREAMGRAALALVEASSYRGAGTAEFLLDAEGRFHFLEMNTRIQVEHPVTEMVYGLDLVAAQLELAEGRWPAVLGDPTKFAVPSPRGVALEARILAEDPRKDFMPATGTLRIYREPAGPGIRVDSGVREGDGVTPHFDSMIAKLIVQGEDRAQAVAKLSWALEQFTILGCSTNLPFLLAVSRHSDFLAGRESTSWIAENLSILKESPVPETWRDFLGTRSFLGALVGILADTGKPPEGPAARFAAQTHPELRVGGSRDKSGFRLLRQEDHPNHFVLLRLVDGITLDLWACRRGNELEIAAFGDTWTVEDPTLAASQGSTDGLVRSPMAGKVLEVKVGVGDRVGRGQILFLVESMKMQMEVAAPRSGRIASIAVGPGQILPGPEPMAVLDVE